MAARVVRSPKQIYDSEPSRDCEVFVYRIPASVSEEELASMFEKYGEIYKLRLVRKATRKGKNYAFVRFTDPNAVRSAVLRWNGYEIRKEQRILVCKSVDNKCLVLCSIPKYLTSLEIYNLLKRFVEGLQKVQAVESREFRNNSGLAILKFDTHTSAAIAKKVLRPLKRQLWKRPVAVEWYTPGLEWNDYAVSKIYLLF